MRVRKGGVYRFNPVSFDRFDPCHNIAVGEHVRVGKVPGFPHAATVNAGCVHVYRIADDSHCGFVLVNSLERIS
jgi:hypothetical protein